MSRVDADLRGSERQDFLDEVRHHLPAFLSPAATERVDPVGDVTELLNLRRGDLRRVMSVHVALSEEVLDFIRGLRHGLRQPLTSSERPRIATQAVRGPIDWPATIGARALGGGNEALYVVRPANRIFDIPENRALVWVLVRLGIELGRIPLTDREAPAGVADQSWIAQIAAHRARIRAARRHQWLREIPPERPTARTLQRLASARTTFYKKTIPAVIDLLRRFTEEDPTAEDLTELLSRRYFEPARNWQLFEVVIALRLARAFGAVAAGRRKSRLLVGAGRSPYGRYALPGGDEIRLWYQAWPHDVGQSLHRDALGRYEIAGEAGRPDLVIERRRDGVTVDAVLLELKASRSAATLSGGLLQLLGYLKDRPDIFGTRPSAWLVALPSRAFRTADAEGRELWGVDSAQVAEAAVERLTMP